MRNLVTSGPMAAAAQSPFAQPVPESFACASASFEILVSVVLVIAGAQLLRRRRSGRTLHVVYCVGKVVQVIVGATIFIFMMHQVTSMASTMPTSGPASVGLKFGMLMGGIGGGLGMLFSLIYPVFLIIWFLRPAVKQELASWRTTGVTVEA